MKAGARVLGIDDTGHSLDDPDTKIVGVVYRGTEFIEDVRFGEVEVDGDDATQKVIGLHERCKNTEQIAAVIVDGISVAGFNLIDISRGLQQTREASHSVDTEPARPRQVPGSHGKNRERRHQTREDTRVPQT
nr:MAG: hypothetical protein J07AB56_07530 [Candidatus Nanosalinarum sp. J07AB56]